MSLKIPSNETEEILVPNPSHEVVHDFEESQGVSSDLDFVGLQNE